MAKRRLSPDTRETLGVYFGNLFFNVMIGMTRAKSVEEEHGKLGVKLKELTEERMRKVANYAGAHFAKRANPSPKKLSEKEIDDLKIKAIEFALDQLEHETKADGSK
jgi:hypothetical protein